MSSATSSAHAEADEHRGRARRRGRGRAAGRPTESRRDQRQDQRARPRRPGPRAIARQPRRAAACAAAVVTRSAQRASRASTARARCAGRSRSARGRGRSPCTPMTTPADVVHDVAPPEVDGRSRRSVRARSRPRILQNRRLSPSRCAHSAPVKKIEMCSEPNAAMLWRAWPASGSCKEPSRWPHQDPPAGWGRARALDGGRTRRELGVDRAERRQQEVARGAEDPVQRLRGGVEQPGSEGSARRRARMPASPGMKAKKSMYPIEEKAWGGDRARAEDRVHERSRGRARRRSLRSGRCKLRVEQVARAQQRDEGLEVAVRRGRSRRSSAARRRRRCRGRSFFRLA